MTRPPSEAADGRPWLWTVLAMALALLVAERADAPPDPRGEDAPADVFSAARARATLARILGDERPHPTGSAANAAVRDRIVDELRALGASPQIQSTISCRGGTCGWIDNVVAVLGVDRPGPAVLVAVHYDSVPAGPGASDDGSGVAAALEVARALQAGEPLGHPVILLLDDGEEVGLLGADAFVRQHPLAASVGVVINLEARGSRGPSTMFETKGPNGWLVRALAQHVPQPAMASLSAAVYDLLPNDTDLTVFGEVGWAGVNFAFSDGVEHYHTPLDDLAHLDDRSLQHHGDNALAAVRALAQGPIADPPTDAVVYVDVFGRWVLRWPRSWALPLAIAVLAAALGLVVLARRRMQRRPGRVVAWTLGLLGLLLVGAGLGLGVVQLVAAIRGGTAPMFEPSPWGLRLGVWGAGFFAVVSVAMFARRPAELALAATATWTLLATAVALALPGASNVVWIPALVGLWPAAVAATSDEPRRLARASATFAVVAVLFVGRLLLPIESTLGFAAAPASALVVGLVALPALPLVAAVRTRDWRRRIGLAAALVVGGGTILAASVPAGTTEHPTGINLVRMHDRPAGTSRFAAASFMHALPESLADQGIDPIRQVPPGSSWPWSILRAYLGPIESTVVPPAVTVTPLASGRADRLQVRVVPAEGIEHVELYLPASVSPASVRVDGRSVPAFRDVQWTEADGTKTPYAMLWLVGLPADGVEVELATDAVGPVTLRTSATRYQWPDTPAARALRAARPATAVPFQWGDVEVTTDAHVVAATSE